jgi:ribosome-binding protein aMBF1 (putative translation factor)
MAADDLRHLRASLRALLQNITAAGKIHRRLRHGLHVASRRLEAWAQAVSIQARGSSEASPDSWPQDRFEFGAAVLRTRERAGLNRARFAGLIGTSNTTIANIEGGRACRASTRRLIVEVFAALERTQAGAGS